MENDEANNGLLKLELWGRNARRVKTGDICRRFSPGHHRPGYCETEIKTMAIRRIDRGIDGSGLNLASEETEAIIFHRSHNRVNMR